MEAFEKVSELEKRMEEVARQLQQSGADLSQIAKGEITEFPDGYRSLSEEVYTLAQRANAARSEAQHAATKVRQLGIKDIALLKK